MCQKLLQITFLYSGVGGEAEKIPFLMEVMFS